LRPRYGLPEGARPGSRARTSVEAPGRSSQRHAGKIGSRGPVPLCEGKRFEGPNPERARHEIGPWRSREKEGAERAREPWGRNVPGEASPGRSGFPRSQALKGQQPHGRRRTREGHGSRLRSDSEGETRPRELEASVQIVHWRQRAGETPRRPPGSRQGHGGCAQPMGALRRLERALKDRRTPGEEPVYPTDSRKVQP